MVRRGFVCGRDLEQHRLAERAREEVDADRQRRCGWADELRAERRTRLVCPHVRPRAADRARWGDAAGGFSTNSEAAVGSDRRSNQGSYLLGRSANPMGVSRREFVALAAGTAATAFSRRVFAAGGSVEELTGFTLAEAAARVRSGAVTSTQLTQACLERIAIYDPKLDAFITVMKEHGARAGTAARCRTEGRTVARAAARRADRDQGHHRYGGHAHDRRQRAVRRSRAGRGCDGRRAPQGGRRRHHRQDEHARICDGRRRDVVLRPVAQSLEPRAQHRRLVVGFGRRDRGMSELRRAGHRHRRLRAHAGIVLRHRGLEAHLWARTDSRHHAAHAVARSLRSR